MIMKKYSAVVLAVFLCGAPVFAAGNVVAPKLIDQLEQTVYGEVRAGSLVSRLLVVILISKTMIWRLLNTSSKLIPTF